LITNRFSGLPELLAVSLREMRFCHRKRLGREIIAEYVNHHQQKWLPVGSHFYDTRED